MRKYYIFTKIYNETVLKELVTFLHYGIHDWRPRTSLKCANAHTSAHLSKECALSVMRALPHNHLEVCVHQLCAGTGKERCDGSRRTLSAPQKEDDHMQP